MKYIDRTGKQYGSLIAENKAPGGKWVCLCLLCGSRTEKRATNLSSGHTKTCGCLRINFKDETGKQYGNLKVLRRAKERSPSRKTYWVCECLLCGNQKNILGEILRSGMSQSCGCSWTLPNGESAKNQLKNGYKNSAKKRGLEFSLTDEQFTSITQRNCNYCGSPPKQVSSLREGTNGDYRHNGIDRVDSSIGYIVSNCVACCSQCNYAKRTAPAEQFLQWVKRVYEHCIAEKRCE